MSNFYKSDKAEKIKLETDRIREKNNTQNQIKSGCGCNFVGLTILAVIFLALFLVVFIGFSAIENNFLEITANHEEKFKILAVKYANLTEKTDKPKDSDIFDNQQNYKPLICYEKPDRNKRHIARINYNIPKHRQPNSIQEANPIIRIKIKNERTYKTQGSYKTDFPIYDIIIDYIDVKKNKIVFTQIIKGDPQNYNDNNRLSPGTIPITQAEKEIASVMRYEPNFAWNDSY